MLVDALIECCNARGQQIRNTISQADRLFQFDPSLPSARAFKDDRSRETSVTGWPLVERSSLVQCLGKSQPGNHTTAWSHGHFVVCYSTSALSLSPTWESRVRYTRPPQQVRWSSPRRLPCARCTGSSGSGCATGSQTTGPPTRQAFQRETIAGRIRQPPTQPMQTSPRQARIRSEAPPRKADFPAQSRRTA